MELRSLNYRELWRKAVSLLQPF